METIALLKVGLVAAAGLIFWAARAFERRTERNLPKPRHVTSDEEAEALRQAELFDRLPTPPREPDRPVRWWL
jgi:hypothetical protein